MKRILISGGSGLVGTRLQKLLRNKDYEVLTLTRKASNLEENEFHWNIYDQKIDRKALNNIDYIIHLAGENIGAKNWSKKQKAKILKSRVDSSKLIVNSIREAQAKPKAIISSSAIGFYGLVTTEKIFNEQDEPSNDFLGNVCQQWENEINHANDLNIRTVNIRTGIVLSNEGGALPKINKPVKMGLGSAIGSGKQFMPWIHIDDLCEVYIHAIENEKLQGPVNAVAAEHITNADFMTTLANVQNKKIRLPNVPGFLLKLYLGEMAQLVLTGSRVSSNKLLNSGFTFKYKNLKLSLENLFA